VISGDPRTVLAVLSGRMGLEEAEAAAVAYRVGLVEASTSRS
jgi:hypothetical protein